MNTKTASEQVIQDLIDCLLAEDFFGDLNLMNVNDWNVQQSPSSKQTLKPYFQDAQSSMSKIWQWHYDLPEQRSIVTLLQPSITQAWERVPHSPVLLCQYDQCVELTPSDFLRYALEGVKDRYRGNEKGLALFQEVLGISVHQTLLSQDHRIESRHLLEKDNAAFFLAMEQWASLRDRPYHPLAKAKHGLSDQEYRAYQAEFNQPVTLNWVAIRKDWLQTGDGIVQLDRQQPSQYLLPDKQAETLLRELTELGLQESHVAIPVHPWQFDHVLEKQLGKQFAAGHCQRLTFTCGNFFASSSLRSMTPCFDSNEHLKLPMAIYSLGASRYLPAVKMINGGYSEKLLQQSKTLDPVLEEKLFLCEEDKWWAFMPPEATLFDEAPRHLSAMIRTYPNSLLKNPDTRIMPMAALGTPLHDSKDHFFDEWLSYRNLSQTKESVLMLFKELASCFFEVNLRMFRIGMLGEAHGQNAVFVWNKGQAHGMLLRDHDSLRIYVPWLEANGMTDPNYCIKPGHANTLYHDRPEDLLFWLQTLAIQVNMRSIIDTLSLTYNIENKQLWQVMGAEIKQLIKYIKFSDEVRSMLIHELFECDNWPQKHLLSPMIDRAGGPGSMPFGKGTVVNPFKQLS
ncbi:Aerobactin synthase [Marinomonas spartinae]|uniref:IucA/IucC family protein n=1 Tax=Marinomonas spartinae TaxID=1792290 RepID=UPI000808C4E6|nr:IucA/IucC family protein [Marinomonas spartinae]SBS35628.1 Aerobactin synthase [Marinomonas spartinae]